MPIAPDTLRSALQHALTNEILSSRESDRILEQVRKAGGLDSAGAAAVVETLTQALRGEALDLTTSARLRNLDALLGALNRLSPLPLTDGGASGSMSLVELLRKKAGESLEPPPGDPTPPPVDLSVPSYGGTTLGVSADGSLFRNGQRVDTDLRAPSADTVDALWGLNRQAALIDLAPEAQTALARKLADGITSALAVPEQDAPKYRRHVAIAAALGALSQIKDRWDAATAEAVLAVAAEAPTPLMQALAQSGLSGATLTDEQRTRRDALQAPEGAEALMRFYNELRREKQSAGMYAIKGTGATYGLSALVFAAGEEAFNNVLKGMTAWTKVDGRGWNPDTLAHMHDVLETYVDSYPQVTYQYGTFETEAPKQVAKITSERAVAKVKPQLEADPPRLQGIALTREQADYILSIIGTVRDDAAVTQLARCLDEVHSAWERSAPSSWNDPVVDAPLSPSAFAIFERAAGSYQDSAEARPDGKLGYDDLATDLRQQANELREVLRPRLADINGNPPSWEGVRIDEATATYLRGVLSEQLRSPMSVENISRAISIVADHHQGTLEGAGGSKLREIIDDYAANWPSTRFLDFNKLERIASYQVRGQPVPLAKINGEVIALGEFFQKVGTTVEAAINPADLRHAWMADRWGFRAKTSVELLDIIAEQSVRGEGPLAVLRQRHPTADISVEVTGRAGAHEEFVFVVNQNGRVTRFTQGSDGTIGAYRQDTAPVLFTATIGAAGDLDVSIPRQISARSYPLQSTYSVGDSIDLTYYDANAEEKQVEGQPFSTRSKILEATIMGYTYDGQYIVEYTPPGGQPTKKTIPFAEVRKTNSPHFYSHHAYREDFIDVSLDFKTDEALRGFLEGADPIINRHLPANDPNVQLAAMTPREIARRQLACIKELMKYAAEHMSYPVDENANPDDASQSYHDLLERNYRVPLGKLLDLRRGVCRHQCIAQHLLLQRAGIDSRLAEGAANTSSGNFRGYHIWVEVQLADGARYLSDQTWSDPAVALWEGAYDTDKRRVEMYRRTASYDSKIVS